MLRERQPWSHKQHFRAKHFDAKRERIIRDFRKYGLEVVASSSHRKERKEKTTTLFLTDGIVFNVPLTKM